MRCFRDTGSELAKARKGKSWEQSRSQRYSNGFKGAARRPHLKCALPSFQSCKSCFWQGSPRGDVSTRLCDGVLFVGILFHP